MVTGILAFVTALFAALPRILSVIEARYAKRNEAADALAKIEVGELDAGMDAVDHELRQRP